MKSRIVFKQEKSEDQKWFVKELFCEKSFLKMNIWKERSRLNIKRPKMKKPVSYWQAIINGLFTMRKLAVGGGVEPPRSN